MRGKPKQELGFPVRKPQLALQVAAATGVSKERAADIVAIMLEEITLALIQHDEVFIPGFGRFSKRYRPGRSGRDLRSGQAIEIPAHHAVCFRPASKLKNVVNGTD